MEATTPRRYHIGIAIKPVLDSYVETTSALNWEDWVLLMNRATTQASFFPTTVGDISISYRWSFRELKSLRELRSVLKGRTLTSPMYGQLCLGDEAIQNLLVWF